MEGGRLMGGRLIEVGLYTQMQFQSYPVLSIHVPFLLLEYFCSRYFDFLVYSMTIWSAQKLPKIAWPTTLDKMWQHEIVIVIPTE